MKHVDALSRNPLPSCLLVSECREGLTARLRWAQRKDDDLSKIFEATKRGEMNGYIIRGGILYKEVGDDIPVIIPKAMQMQIIRKIHEQVNEPHFGVNKTETLVKADYWIPNFALESRECGDELYCMHSSGKKTWKARMLIESYRERKCAARYIPY